VILLQILNIFQNKESIYGSQKFRENPPKRNQESYLGEINESILSDL
jgi:hypothetical protein